MMGDGYDEDLIVVEHVHDLIFELPNAKLSNSLGERGTNCGVLFNKRDCVLDFTLKTRAKADHLTIEIRNGFFELRLCRLEKTSLCH